MHNWIGRRNNLQGSFDLSRGCGKRTTGGNATSRVSNARQKVDMLVRDLLNNGNLPCNPQESLKSVHRDSTTIELATPND
jgi:hypothetical protein